MIIFIGGFVGSGRNALAKELARKSGYHFYSKRIPELYALRAVRKEEGKKNIFTDEIRSYCFRQIADDLPALLRKNNGIVITFIFHREKPRNLLFNAAKKISDTLVIWIDSSDEEAHAREIKMDDRTLMPEEITEFRQMMKEQFEPLKIPHLTFKNTGTFSDSSERLYELVKKEIDRRR